MAHTLKIAGAEYKNVPRVDFVDSEGNIHSFYDRDDIYLKAERDVIVVLENGTLLPIDQTSVVIQSSEPEEATVWLQTEG